MRNLVNIQLHGQSRYYQADAHDLSLQQGDSVIVEDENGQAFAQVMDPPYQLPSNIYQEEPLSIIREACEEDLKHFADNNIQEKEALAIAKERIAGHNLEMNLVSAYVPFDNNKLLFYFTADGRIDFRELVRDLASIFHTRIELRQIGVRDEAGMIGGLGVCGRELCCASFLQGFQPVSIRMAKDQNLSMNPSKISGSCGRLLCCLNYEQEAYVSAAERLPSKNSKVRYKGEVGTVESVNLLKETLQIKFDREDEAERMELKIGEVRVIHDPSKKKSETQEEKIMPQAGDEQTFEQTQSAGQEKAELQKTEEKPEARQKIKSGRRRRSKSKPKQTDKSGN